PLEDGRPLSLVTPRVAQGPWDRLSHRTGTSFPVAGSVCWDWAVSLPLALQEGLQDGTGPSLFRQKLTWVCASHTVKYTQIPRHHVRLPEYRFGWELAAASRTSTLGGGGAGSRAVSSRPLRPLSLRDVSGPAGTALPSSVLGGLPSLPFLLPLISCLSPPRPPPPSSLSSSPAPFKPRAQPLDPRGAEGVVVGTNSPTGGADTVPQCHRSGAGGGSAGHGGHACVPEQGLELRAQDGCGCRGLAGARREGHAGRAGNALGPRLLAVGEGQVGRLLPAAGGSSPGDRGHVAPPEPDEMGEGVGSEEGPEGAVGPDQPLGCLLTPLSEPLRTDLGVCIWTLFPVFLDFLAVDLRRLPEVSMSSPGLPASECCPAALASPRPPWRPAGLRAPSARAPGAGGRRWRPCLRSSAPVTPSYCYAALTASLRPPKPRKRLPSAASRTIQSSFQHV
uniref:Uncharacterized protein n=1 Tax=Mustela putorius furo TaxID=9669 RepID=M3YNF1_MUSPF